MADITGFRASIGTGLVRANQFRVTIKFPAIMAGFENISALGQFHVRAANLPSSTIASVPVYFQGRAVHVAGEREFQPWAVSVYNENFALRDALMTWSHRINNIHNNTGVITVADYQADLFVEQLDRNGRVLKTVTIHHAMPVEIGEIALDFQDNNSVEMFGCQFVYNYFTDSAVNADGIRA
jgi:hypothetical protein